MRVGGVGVYGIVCVCVCVSPNGTCVFQKKKKRQIEQSDDHRQICITVTGFIPQGM